MMKVNVREQQMTFRFKYHLLSTSYCHIMLSLYCNSHFHEQLPLRMIMQFYYEDATITHFSTWRLIVFHTEVDNFEHSAYFLMTILDFHRKYLNNKIVWCSEWYIYIYIYIYMVRMPIWWIGVHHRREIIHWPVWYLVSDISTSWKANCYSFYTLMSLNQSLSVIEALSRVHQTCMMGLCPSRNRWSGLWQRLSAWKYKWIFSVKTLCLIRLVDLVYYCHLL